MKRFCSRVILGVLLSTTGLASIPAKAQNGPLWVRELGTAGKERWSGVATDPVNNEITAVGDGGGALAGPGSYQGGGFDCLIARYTADGNLLWVREFGTSQRDRLYAAATAPNRNIAVSGYTGGTLGGPQRGIYDAIVGMYSPQGAQLWINHQLGSTAEDISAAVAVDRFGNVFAVGWTEGPIFPGASQAGGRDAWLAKFSATGQLLWVRQFGTTNLDALYGVGADSSGNVYVGGLSRGSLYGTIQRGSGSFVYSDAILAKYNGTTGALIWGRQFGTTNAEVLYGLAVDGNDNVVASGITQGALFGPRAGDYDVIAVKYDRNGNRLWAQQFGSSTTDYGTGAATDANNNVFVSGSAGGVVTPGGTPGTFLRKFDPLGNVLWTRQAGPVEPELSWDVTTDSTGAAIIAGERFVTGFPLSGNDDARLVKYGPNG